jgi:hypothetical protein
MTLPHPIVFLIDVDNTLLDNHGIQQDPSISSARRLWSWLSRPYPRLRSAQSGHSPNEGAAKILFCLAARRASRVDRHATGAQL